MRNPNLSKDRVGEINIMNDGNEAKIIDYKHNKDITIEFTENGEIINNNTYKNFKDGKIKSRFLPNVCDVGYIGMGRSKDDNGRNLKVYDIWRGMLMRCYDEKVHNREPLYKGCSVCDEWLNYSNFKKWYEDNYYIVNNEKMHLDKDILHKGNKVYSSENCIIVPERINELFVKNNKRRGEFPLGVYFNKPENKFISTCRIIDINGVSKKKHIGYHNTPEDAFYLGYKPFKENYIKQVAEKYKEFIPNKLYDALYRYVVEITD